MANIPSQRQGGVIHVSGQQAECGRIDYVLDNLMIVSYSCKHQRPHKVLLLKFSCKVGWETFWTSFLSVHVTSTAETWCPKCPFHLSIFTIKAHFCIKDGHELLVVNLRAESHVALFTIRRLKEDPPEVIRPVSEATVSSVTLLVW